MAAFSFNFYGYDYEHGLTVLRDSLLAATDGLTAKGASIEREWQAYEDGVAAGDIEEQAEHDEETGALIWSQSAVYEHDVKLIAEGVQALRKAYVIALYHHWERIIRQWTTAPSEAVHAQLVDRVRDRGIIPPLRFEHIYRLNNVLKHDSGRSGPKLLEGWPELFRTAENLKERLAKGSGRIRWEGAITISPNQMEEIFIAMRRSGPAPQ